MSTVPPEIATALRKAFEDQRQQIMVFLKELKEEGFTPTPYDCPYLRWEDMARYSVGGKLSCWGPDIADITSHYATEGMFALVEDGKEPKTIEDLALQQCLKRVYTDNTTTCIMVSKDNKQHYAYKTIDGVRITTHEGLEVVASVKAAWAIKGVAVSPEAASKVDECVAEKMAQRFSHEGRDVWAIPDGTGMASLVNYTRAGNMDAVVKSKVPIFTEVESGDVRDDLAVCFPGAVMNRAATMPVSQVFMLDKDTTTTSTIVSPNPGDGKLTILNHGGVGKHAVVKYFGGFDLPLYTIRSPNWNERLSAVSLERAKVCHDNVMVKLSDVAKRAGEMASRFGLSDKADLSAETDTEAVNTIRFQATIVPGSREGNETEVYEKVYNYQTDHDMRPTALYSYHTSFGTSFTSAGESAVKIQPSTYDGEKLSAFNLRVEASKKQVGDDDTYTEADNQENTDAGFGMAIRLGPLGFPKVANATMLVQWPVSAKSVPVACAPPEEPMFDEGGEDGGIICRSCAALAPRPPAPVGDLYASRCAFGSYQGEARGIKNPDLARRTNSKPTMTYNRFYSLQAPADSEVRDTLPGMYTIKKDQVKMIVKMLDEMYELAGKSHNLADPDAVSAVKISSAEFAKAPLGPSVACDRMDTADDEAGDDDRANRARMELKEVKRPRMAMIQC